MCFGSGQERVQSNSALTADDNEMTTKKAAPSCGVQFLI